MYVYYVLESGRDNQSTTYRKAYERIRCVLSGRSKKWVEISMDEDYLTPPQVAKRLRVDYYTVTRWIKYGLLEAETIRQGRRNRHRIKKAAIEKIEAPSPPRLYKMLL